MKHRLIFGSLFIALLVGLIVADERFDRAEKIASAPASFQSIGILSFHGAMVVIILLALVVLATREMTLLLRAANHAPLAGWTIAINAALLLTPFIAANGYPSNTAALHAHDWQYTMTLVVAAFAGTAVGVAARKKTGGAMDAIGATLVNIAYIGLLAPFIIRLRVFGPTGASWLLLYYVGVVKCCDMGAYFTGRAFGKTKLIEWLSPKKTIEGLAGGVTASVVVAVGIPIMVRAMATTDSAYQSLFPTPGRAVIFGITMALVGHAGDLLESLFKRDAQMKDSAAAIPAFGGVLDIIDSPLLTAPFAYWILLAA